MDSARLTQIRQRFEMNYGFDVGESGGLFLLLLEDEFLRLSKTIDIAGERLKLGRTFFQTESSKAAFWYGVGLTLPLALVGLISIGFLYWGISQWQTYRQAVATIDYSQKAKLYTSLISKGQIVSGQQAKVVPEKATYLRLNTGEQSDRIVVGENYLLSHEKGVVYIPLRFNP